MAALVGVHGIAQQRSGPERQARMWRDAFHRGLRRAHCPEHKFPTLAVAFYGHLFRKGSPFLDGIDEQDWDAEEIEFVAGALDEFTAGLSEAELDELVRASVTLGPPGFIPPRLLRGLAAIDRRWGTGRGLLLVGELRQVNAYLFLPEAGEQIRQIVIDAVSDDTKALIGHSLGSVIVYDLIVRGLVPQIRTLITLGSPLSLATVRSALPQSAAGEGALPANLLWLNVYDPRDFVTCGMGLRPRAQDIPVKNHVGDPHALSEYLSREETAQAILRGIAE